MHTPSLAEVKAILNQVNADCEANGEPTAPFDDVEYYTERIVIMWELDEQTAHDLAEQLNS